MQDFGINNVVLINRFHICNARRRHREPDGATDVARSVSDCLCVWHTEVSCA